MYVLTLYDWRFDGEVRATLFYHNPANAQKRAWEYMEQYVEWLKEEHYTPDDFEHKSWDDYIAKAVKNWECCEVFDLSEIEWED